MKRPARTVATARRSAPRPRARRRESREARAARTAEIIARLEAEYPDAQCSLTHADPYQLLVATILSAQCTDARVNMVTPALFARYPDAHALADADQEELERIIQSTGFFRSKARNLIGMARAVTERHGGSIPATMEELVALPGVGRKTANVLLGNAFGIDEGIVVDTHVTRLSQRLGLTQHTDAIRIEQDLIALVPRSRWTLVPHLFIDHGRAVCIARAPRCTQCVVADLCPSARLTS
ncbi:MAG TPA: endonuclease III [Gemmatimonadaceae bacterium]|nr:endonuclease III [Gemmatimonadaceae bacterium]